MELTPEQRMAVAGVLGAAGHTIGHAWAESEGGDPVVRDALILADMIGWDQADMEGLWSIAIELCRMGFDVA